MATMRSDGGRRSSGALAAGALLVLGALFVWPGCQADQAPPPPPGPLAGLAFAPEGAAAAVDCGGHRDFEVLARAVDVDSMVWSAAGDQSGHGPRFRYFARDWRPDTVRVAVHRDGAVRVRRWIVDKLTGLESAGFEPAVSAVDVVWGSTADFAVRTACAPLSTLWSLDGEPSGEGSAFRWTPDATGAHVLTAAVDFGDTVFTRSWELRVVVPSTELVCRPAADVLELDAGQTQIFSVQSDAPLTDVRWTLDGAAAGTGNTYLLSAVVAGRHLVAASVGLPDTTVVRVWHVEVLAPEIALPPPVRDLAVRIGPLPTQTTVTWSGVVPEEFAVVAYEVRTSTAELVRDGNWPAAVPFDRGSWPAGPDAFSVVVDNADQGWATGTTVWFAARAVDSRGVLSTVVASPALTIDNHEWWAEGVCTGPDGAPAAGAEVADLRSGWSDACDPAGRFRIGPLPLSAVAQLEAGGIDPATGLRWSAQQSGELSLTTVRRHDFLLIPEYGLDPSCPHFAGVFTKYLRWMTLTVFALVDRPNLELVKWDAYPVAVHVPPDPPGDALDHAAACREAVAIWNDSMGDQFLRLVEEAPAVGIRFVYGAGEEVFGRAILEQPGDGARSLGQVVPERVRIELRTDFPTMQRLTETALHELGHCLGLYNHTYCSQTPYLMDVTAGGALDGGRDHAIHLDERRAVRIIRLLPQRHDMSPYALH